MTTKTRIPKVSTATPSLPPCADFSLDNIHLATGAHGEAFNGEACLIEYANVAAACIPELREKYGAAPFADNHPSICPVIRSFGMSWNDALNDEDRDRLLKPFVTRVLGTKASKKIETQRAWMATDWLARVCAPAWLRLAGLTEHAQALESIARIVDARTAGKAQPTLEAAESAARSAAESAAESAARSAAWSAAESAARSAARSAAESAARSAAESAAESALAPTVLALQESAVILFDEMIRLTEKPANV